MKASRRDFLRFGAIPFLGLNFPDYLQAATATKKSVIFIFLYGGPSHIDTYDPKPNAPLEIRGKFSAISTNVSGMQLSEVFPKQAQIADKFSIIRSFSHNNSNHTPAQLFSMTGHDSDATQLHYPFFGCVASKLIEQKRKSDLLNIFLGERRVSHYSPNIGNQGILNAKYAPQFIEQNPNKSNFKIDIFNLTEGITLERLRGRQSLLAELERMERFSGRVVKDMNEHQQSAFNVLLGEGVKQAFDIESESEEIRGDYGHTEFGQRLLLARRLVEAGVPFVGLEFIPDSAEGYGWDHHGYIFDWLPLAALPFDQSISALIRDLESRGMLDDVLVLAFGEFGRTYKVNQYAGRDHWPRVGSVFIAGGGVPGGRIFGASDSRGADVKDSPVRPADLLATVYSLLGYAPDTRIIGVDGRPHFLSDGKPIMF